MWVYMRWHSEHEMGHFWASQESLAAGPRRYGHDLTRRRAREKTGRRASLWRHISGKNCGTDPIEMSGVVEPRWRYHDF